MSAQPQPVRASEERELAERLVDSLTDEQRQRLRRTLRLVDSDAAVVERGAVTETTKTH